MLACDSVIQSEHRPKGCLSVDDDRHRGHHGHHGGRRGGLASRNKKASFDRMVRVCRIEVSACKKNEKENFHDHERITEGMERSLADFA